MNLDELRTERAKLAHNSEIISNNMDIIIDETQRVADIAHNASGILNELDYEFEQQTGLDKTDIKFLFLATALQVARWIVIAITNRALSEQINSSRVPHNDSTINDSIKQSNKKFKSKHEEKWGAESIKSSNYPTWTEIIGNPAPYDATKGASMFGINMEGGYHRLHTLGHDPVLGWIFGTMNFLSNTITTDNFRTFTVTNFCLQEEITLLHGFAMAIESIKEDKHRLPAAIFSEAVHLKSDTFTKLGLPIPILEVFSPEIAGKLYKSNYDSLCLTKDLAVWNLQAVFSNLIDMIISLIHGLFYDPQKYESRDVYEVKTKKILMYSNLISSASNIIWVSGNALVGDKTAIRDLDVGGMMTTIYRLINDTKYIRKIKEEFVFGGFNKLIQGYSLDIKTIDEI